MSDSATRQLLDALVGHIEALRDDGARWVVLSPALLAEATGPLSRPRLGHRDDPRPSGPASNRAFGITSAPTAPQSPPATPSMAPPPRPALDGPAMDRAAKIAALSALHAKAKACIQCAGIARARTSVVFGVGDPDAAMMLVGEAPGREEDQHGEPFVGPAGQLLTKILVAMGLGRDHVYIANVLKCRPPENRDPSAEETRTCTPWLDRQIELVNPKVLVPLGKHASNHLLGIAGPELRSMGSLRERVHEHAGRKLVPTFHPSYLLRTPEAKKDCWKDIQLAMGLLGLSPRRNG